MVLLDLKELKYHIENVRLPDQWVSQYNLPASFRVGGGTEPTLLILGVGFLAKYGPVQVDTYRGLTLSVSRITNNFLVSGIYTGSEVQDVACHKISFGGLSRVDREFLYQNIVPEPHPLKSEFCTGCKMLRCAACEADQFNLDPLVKLENQIIFKSISFTGKNYTTELPFKDLITQLPCYYREAVNVFERFERKIMKNNNHLSSYNCQIQTMIDEGIFSIVDEKRPSGSHITSNIALNSGSTSTPIRVVHNGSFATQGRPSLNDCLLKGSSGNRKISQILTTLRLYKYLAVADVRRAYTQIKLGPHCKKFMKIIHRENGLGSQGKLLTSEPNRLMFGVKSAQSVFGMCKNSAADQFIENEEVRRQLKEDSYTDNLHHCSESEIELEKFIETTQEGLSKASFEIKNQTWVTNMSNNQYSKENISLLGLQFDPINDTFTVKISFNLS